MASRTYMGRVAAYAAEQNIWRRGKWWLVGGGELHRLLLAVQGRPD